MKLTNTLSIAIVLAGACLSGACSDNSTVDSANAVLENVRRQMAPDSRQIVDELKAHINGGKLVVAGATSESFVKDAAIAALDSANIEFIDSITVYPTDLWLLVRIPAASLRTGPKHAAEMATQAVMGMPMRLLEKNDEFWRVQTPDGYIAYVPSTSVVEKTAQEMAEWRGKARYTVTSPYQIRAYRTAEASGLRDVVTDLVNGCIVEDAGMAESRGRVKVVIPDGRQGWVNKSDITPIADWAAQNFNAEKILDIAYSMEGTPYLWGGTSTKAIDCSGLAKVSYFSNGIILMRDASQQAKTGTRIEATDWQSCQPGDLLFFGNAETGRVTHVAIYDHDGNYIHSSGLVKRNSVDPQSDSYLTTPFLHAVRIAGNEGNEGITLVRNHPWFFNL